MYHIAICDDDIKTCSELEKIVLQFGEKHGIKFEVDIWYSGEKLCLFLEEENVLDLLFLDIELVAMNGIAVGKYIRNQMENRECGIIYISSKSSYAMSLFKLQPLDFLLKPLKAYEIEAALADYIAEYERKNHLFEYHMKKCVHKIPYKNIMYFYSDNKKINIVTTDGVQQFNGKMRDIINVLPHNFLMVHQSFIVNSDFVEAYQYETVTMQGGIILNISRAYRNAVRDQIAENSWKK